MVQRRKNDITAKIIAILLVSLIVVAMVAIVYFPAAWLGMLLWGGICADTHWHTVSFALALKISFLVGVFFSIPSAQQRISNIKTKV